MATHALPELAERYLASKRVERGLRRSSLEEYRRDLADFCRWLAGRRRKAMNALTADDLADVDRETAGKWLAHLDGERHHYPMPPHALNEIRRRRLIPVDFPVQRMRL